MAPAAGRAPCAPAQRGRHTPFDFNATSITRPYQTLCRSLQDCQRQLGQKPSVKTFPSTTVGVQRGPQA